MSEQELKAALEDNNKELLRSMQIIIENVVKPQFNLLADEISIVREKVENLEKKVERIEDTLLEHEFKLRIVK